VSRIRLVITAITKQGLSQAEAARTYGVSQGWVSRLMARYRAEGEAAFEPRSRRPHTSPAATTGEVLDLIVGIRKELADAGHDAGPDTIAWHLEHDHGVVTSRSNIARQLTRLGRVLPEPKKRPKSSYIRFEAAMPNETWQSDFTHYRLADNSDVEILTWLDDCTRYALSVTTHRRVTGPIVVATFRGSLAQHGIPASTLTDNGMVFTVRLAGGRAKEHGRSAFEHELRRLHITQKNSRPGHPTTCGKVERFQQTMKKWLRAQDPQPASLAELQALIDVFVDDYNQRRPHRSLPQRATPAARYNTMPKATPSQSRDPDTHDRVRHDKVDKAGSVTVRHNGRLHHIGVGRIHEGTCVILLVQDLHITVIDAITGEVLRELILNPHIDYQPTGAPKGPTRRGPRK
jgi:transposase InsO family protein